MTVERSTTYDPRTFEPLRFHDALPRFRDGSDSPRDYLERCLARIAEREPVVRAFTVLNEGGARAAADASSERWRAGRPLDLLSEPPGAVMSPRRGSRQGT